VDFHAVYCKDKNYEEIEGEKRSIVIYPNSYDEIQISQKLIMPKPADPG